MFPAVLVSVACLGLEPSDVVAGTTVEAGAMAEYEAARATAGRDAEAHVRLALWCEAHGLDAERWKHLAIAVLADPSHAAARGLLGLVAHGGGWRSPEAISAQVASDTARASALAAYNGRRARMADTADAHWKLALWCEQRGLKPEAVAHLSRVVQLEPGREAAWKRLGYRKQGRRWVTDELIAAEKAEAEARRAADRRWTPLLSCWRNWIGDKAREAELAEGMDALDDPLAVPAIWAILGRGKAAHQKAAVQLLGQVDSPDSTRALALLALDGKSPDVRARAAQTLRIRDPLEVASLLVALLRDPEMDPDPILFHYRLRPVAWGSVTDPGMLYVRGPLYDVLKTYTLDETLNRPVTGPWVGMAFNGFPERVRQQRERQIADLTMLVDQIRRESADLVLAAREHSRQVDQSNAKVIRTLHTTTGQDAGDDRESWRKWWAEERGYAYEPPPPGRHQDLTLNDDKPTYYGNSHLSCFAAGTPVRTLAGPRPIESIAVGDQVLTQDLRTGALRYRPVVEAPHNPPDKLLKIDLGGDVVRATGIHRFWKAGRGWVRARDLQPGDAIRALGSVARVKSVEPDGVAPVYNLRVLAAESYFAGTSGLLVHDNSEVRPVARAFDAAPEPLAATR